MSHRGTVIYHYDGSIDGLFCCFYESYAADEMPLDIRADELSQFMLYPVREIETDAEKASRIVQLLYDRFGKEMITVLRICFLCDVEGQEMAMLRFIRFCLERGKSALQMLGEEPVYAVHSMVKAVRNEAHLLKGFVRFEDYEQGLVAVIEPKHRVLPMLRGHFCARYANENFLIYDQTHHEALLYQPYRARIFSVEELMLPAKSAEEETYQALWRNYYDAVAVEGRENPKCRMTHMPKRFWAHMTEMNADGIRSGMIPMQQYERIAQ